jgi:hypothetical protein
MRIKYALMGSNENPLYLDFWPVVSKVWKELFDITPVLGLIGNEESDLYDDGNGLVIKLKTIDGLDDGLLSQIVRLYLPKFLDGNCIVSDIDMIPLSKKYFIDGLDEYSEEEFIIMSSHHPQTIDSNQYPMCYVAGNDKVFKELFNLDDSWDVFSNRIPNQGWFTDQCYLYDAVNSNPNITYKFPERSGGFVENRIDRIDWKYDGNKLKEGFYIDCHSLRPYINYKTEVDNLINTLLK